MTTLRFSTLALITTTLLSQAAYATNGLAPTGVGMVHRSMGGAAVANPINTTSMATNPASASFIPDGFDVGLELFMPDRSVTERNTGTNYNGNDKTTFFIPEGGYKRSINAKVATGVVVYGNGGMNTGYSTLPRPFDPTKVGVDYQQLFVSPTVSFKVGERNALGISANMVYHKFKAEGASGFDNAGLSSSPGNVTNRGYDSSTGVGATIGWQGQLSPRLSAGISYRSKVKMGKLEKYQGLLANGGEFNVPAATTIGIALKATPKTTVAFDVQRIEYSKVAAIGNSPSLLNPITGVRMGVNGGPGFGWDDQTVYKLGIRHQATPTTALMAGYNYGKTPIKNSDTTLNVLAPATSEKHLSLGAEFQLSPKSNVTVSYIHAFKKEIKGTNNPQPQLGGLDLGGYNLKMDQNAVGFAYSRRF